MPRFLSRQWVDALNTNAGRVTVDPSVRVVIHHRIGGEGYTLRVAEGRASATLDTEDGADIVFVEDRDTALALARGELTAQEAIARGRMKVSGNVPLLVAVAPALAALSDALSTVPVED